MVSSFFLYLPVPLPYVTFDRVEWEWVDFVLKTFNFGEKFRGWIQMLVKNATTSIKTNGFVSKFFSIRMN
jgi:hypothetical protein